MWLLKTNTLNLQLFAEDEVPPYAILSHTWMRPCHEEISFLDMALCEDSKPFPEQLTRKKGFSKFKNAAAVARENGFGYIWIDTACIDKKSSSELQQSINSMYSWYEASEICYIYLDDFEWIPDEDGFSYVSTTMSQDEQALSWQERLKKCRWFTRGWTLQELVAPKRRIFFDKYWTPLCGDLIRSKDLAEVIKERTGIPQDILRKETSLSSLSIATKMRWAAGRQTTQAEDMAYSLLGIFNVNIHMLYGEGRKAAFIRLQKAIMNDTMDESIFAWRSPKTGTDRLYGLLAETPDWFIDCTGLQELVQGSTPPWVWTNKGLRVSLYTAQQPIPAAVDSDRQVFLNWVNLETGIGLSFQLVSQGDERYARTGDLKQVRVPFNPRRQLAYVPQGPSKQRSPPASFQYLCTNVKSPQTFFVEPFSSGPGRWDPAENKEGHGRGTIQLSPPSLMDDMYHGAIALMYRQHPQARPVVVADITLSVKWFEPAAKWGCLCVLHPAKEPYCSFPTWSARAESEVLSGSQRCKTNLEYGPFRIKLNWSRSFSSSIVIKIGIRPRKGSSEK